MIPWTRTPATDLERLARQVDPYENVWLGTTVENQEYADIRIPHLLSVPAVVHFLSVEPLLGPVDLTPYLAPRANGPSISWVIVGCESGSQARPMLTEWVRAIREQCARFGVAFFLKQAASDRGDIDVPIAALTRGPSSHDGGLDGRGGRVIERPLLDGVEHVAFPVPRSFRRASSEVLS
jgi:hypothetical protein